MKSLIPIFTAALFSYTSLFSAAASYEPGGAAQTPAIDSFSTWTQFANPDTQTPAIDEIGCLDYALAKIAVRYNLPLQHADVFETSYQYYTTFVAEAIHPSYTKAIYFSEHFSSSVQFIEQIPIYADTADESWQKSYEYCARNQNDQPFVFILEMSTASGSSHFVAVNTVNQQEKRLSIYDSGDRFSEYLGDSVSASRGYHVQTIYTMQILCMPGDIDGNYQITWTDSILLNMLLMHHADYTLQYDANHDGILNHSDVDYIEKYARHIQSNQTSS